MSGDAPAGRARSALAMMSPWRHQLAAGGLALYGLAFVHRVGWFTWDSLALLVPALLLLGMASVIREREPGPSPFGYPAVVMLFLLIAWLTPPGVVQPHIPGVNESYLVALVVFAVTGVVPSLGRWRLPLTAAVLIAGHGMMIVQHTPQGEDVFDFLNHGVDTLLRLHDPYNPDPRVDGNYILTYPPGVLVLLGFFRAALGDVRWGYVVAEAVSMALLAALARRLGRRASGAWPDALILLPLTLPRVSAAYFDFTNHELALVPLGLAALWLTLSPHGAGSAGTPRRARWLPAGLLLGLGIAAKQYFVIFPGIFLAAFVEPATIVVALGTALAIVVPFLAWNPGAMLHRLFGQLAAPPDTTRLELYAAADRLHLASPALVRVMGAAGTAAYLALAWISRRDLGASIRACGLALTLFTLLAPFAAYNYYGYAFWFLCWGLLIPDGWTPARVRAGALKGAV